MQRKIIKQGNNSFTITLPIKWIRSNNIDESSEIFLEQKNNELVLKTNPLDIKEKISKINISGFDDRSLRVILNNRYRSGCTKIILEGETNKLEFIEQIVSNRLLGFEVTEVKKDKIIISSIAEPQQNNLDQIIRKMFFIIKQTFDEESNKDYLKDKLNNYGNYCMRVIINTQNQENPEKNFYKYSIISRLILLQHALCRTNKKHEFKDELLIVFEEFHKAYFSNELEKLRKSHDESAKLIHKILPNKLSNCKPKEALDLYYLGEASRHLYLACVNRLNLFDH
ncbi:MAG: AbrB/MazE/SpoVT family DNA-binding domain-containing protein [Candidatus Woesearchaeota archaeon]